MKSSKKTVIIFAGCNGAGKSTIAPVILKGKFAGLEFVNADVIARGLAAFSPEKVAFEAGRVMLQRLHALADKGESFAFETTLATRSFAAWLPKLIASGYEFRLFYVWLANSDLAVSRVSDRVRRGGHFVPAEIIHRRYHRSVSNFIKLYQPLARYWRVFDNTILHSIRVAADGSYSRVRRVYDAQAWKTFTEIAQSGSPAE